MSLMRPIIVATTFCMALVLGGCSTLPVGNPSPPAPARPVDLSLYQGLWYEFARYDHGFERGCHGVTAEYALEPSGHVRVINTCRVGSATGKVRVAVAKAKPTGDPMNAKLKVAFFGPFYIGSYWVLDRADDYSWAIVGEGSGRYLWILTRMATPGPEDREALVARARRLGYDTSLLQFPQQPPGG